MKNKYPKTTAIILAAGLGSRMKTAKTKQTLKICDKSVLKHTLDAFDATEEIEAIVVVCREDERNFVNKECQNLSKEVFLVNGGNCRAESAALGFSYIPADTEYVMIHDAARCLITPGEISSVAESMYIYGAATASRSVTDTVKRCDANGKILETIPRENLKTVQTPQGFSKKIYEEALKNSPELDSSITDDNMLVEKIGVNPYFVETLSTNIKITASEDLKLAEFILKKREAEA